MPLTIPKLDDRTYQDLLDEALARIPVHTPEWTNFNKSDPGVTLIEIFAFLTENLLYRSNQIPERNRRKFLQLLGVPLRPASSARGIVVFSNERGPLQTITLNGGLEVRAGQVPFYTEAGLDVLPVEAQVFYKKEITNPSAQLKEYYNQLYASYTGQPPDMELRLYETVTLSPRYETGVDLGKEAVDGSLWVAILARAGDKPAENTEKGKEALRHQVREQIGGKTLSLGIVPSLTDASRRLVPGKLARDEEAVLLRYEIPVGGTLPLEPSERVPRYRLLEAVESTNVLTQPGIVQITLPDPSKLRLWDNLDPLEPGVMDFPPTLEDTNLTDRIITWVRIASSAAVQAKLLWVGINATFVNQRAHVANEVLPTGMGTPDQVVVLSKTPVIHQSVRLTVSNGGVAEEWKEIDDLTSAGPEIPVPDLREPPGAPPTRNDLVKVFMVDPESGEIRFGDGFRGARPPFGATLRADYDYGLGREGNVNKGSITSGPALPAGIKVTNPVRTWGGAEPETVRQGEKQITRYLQHRDRMVSLGDCETIVLRTPGVDIGRVEVVPAFNPELTPSEPGDAPGAVTIMVIPKYDPSQPDAPRPDRLFLNSICRYIDSRRLVTTEVFLRGPAYKQIWVSVGIEVIPGKAIAEVREAVKGELVRFLSPLPNDDRVLLDDEGVFLTAPQYAKTARGWPLKKPVVALELMAVASRVPGVSLVNKVLLAEGTEGPKDAIRIQGLELPRVAGISITTGEPLQPDLIRGTAAVAIPGVVEPEEGVTPAAPRFVPVPVTPEECK